MLTIEPMIEIGNIFKLGTKYAEAMGATYLDELGAEQPIGWAATASARRASPPPRSSSPSTSTAASGRLRSRRSTSGSSRIGDEAPAHADRLAASSRSAGLTCMVDDREGSPGVRFADADLIGAPLRVTVGKRTVNDGTVDLRQRRTGESETVPLGDRRGPHRSRA